jgi:hypothetical protein
MRSDPNIIANAMLPAAPQLPDVNAMMQTRTAGLENMYNLDRQQQSDAAAQQTAQEDAIIKAMTPAYAAALGGNGSKEAVIAGFNMLAPEVQASVKPQVDQLLAMGSDEMRVSALQGSLAGSAQGRAILDRIPTGLQQRNAAIQQGQLGVSQQRLALDQQKLDAEAANAGQPVPMTAAQAAAADLAERKFQAEQEAAAQAAETGGIDPKVKIKLDQAYPKASAALQTTTTGLNQDLADVTELLNDPGLKDITGLFGANTPNVSSSARRAQALFDKIKAGAGFSALQSMRAASPTGGALGNVSDTEGRKLEQSVGAFAQNQDYVDFKRALQRYQADLQTANANIQSAFDDTYSYRGASPSAPIVQGATSARQNAEQQLVPPRALLPAGVTVRKN